MRKTLRMAFFLLAVVVGSAFNSVNAQETITFTAETDKGSLSSGSSSKDEMSKDGVTVSCDKAVLARGDNYRFYASSTITISSTSGDIEKVVFTCDPDSKGKYGSAKLSVPKGGVGTYTASSDSKTGTWEGNATSFTLSASAQVRATKIEVTLKAGTEKADPELSLSATDVTATMGKEFTPPTLTNPHSVAVTYSSSNENVATVDANSGAVTLVAPGKTEIDINFAGDATYKAAKLSYNLTVADASGAVTKYVKVTDVSTLKAGDVIVFANEKASVASGAYSKNFIGTVDATISGNELSVDNPSTYTLGTAADNTWTFQTTDGKYLYASSSTSNYIGVEDAVDKNAQATITIANGDATITFTGSNTRNVLQYNSGSPRFTCYAKASQSPVQIYKQQSSKIDEVILTVGSTGYATLYYGERNLKVPENVDVKTYAILDGVLIDNHTYEAGSVIPKGTGVVVNATPGDYSFTITDDATGAFVDNDNQLKGSDEDATTTGGAKYYRLTTLKGANVGFYWGADNGAAFTNPAHKAYLAIPANESATAKAGYAFGGEATGINNIKKQNNTIDLSAPMYNLSGQRVNKDFKGVVIQNGHKYINK